MKRRRGVTLLAALALAAASVNATAPTAWTIEGGHWQQGAASGTYRVVLESVGFEHVSCRAGIAWVRAPASGQAATVLVEVPFAELSSGFWACGADAGGADLDGATLTIPATHTYSGERRTFTARLGGPGEYACVDCGAP